MLKPIFQFVCHFICVYVIAFAAIAESARVAIVIDDIGYRITDEQALNLPGNITYSVLPHTPFGAQLAKQAYLTDRDVLLHIPMEALNGKKLGPGALTHDMNEQQVHQVLEQSYQEVPFAIGINNHMGSLLTQMPAPMAWTMKFLKEKDMLFLDSKTTNHSKAQTMAQRFHVPNLARSVFLDNVLSDDYIEQQFNELIQQAKRKKSVIAIAHPHPETIQMLNKLLPELAANGIALVPLSTMLDQPESQLQIAASSE